MFAHLHSTGVKHTTEITGAATIMFGLEKHHQMAQMGNPACLRGIYYALLCRAMQ